jgi:hypothetical protein
LTAAILDAELSACAAECPWSAADGENWWRQLKAASGGAPATHRPKTKEPVPTVAFAKENLEPGDSKDRHDTL